MPKLTDARRISNTWIRDNAKNISGRVLSIGSGSDQDNEGSRYRLYFECADSYETSDISPTAHVDLKLDVRNMVSVADETYDCVFCGGLLEHVDDIFAAMREINRVMKCGGVLLLGMPFGYRIHRAPQDFWRVTYHGLRYLFEVHRFRVLCIRTITGLYGKELPAAYWARAIKY